LCFMKKPARNRNFRARIAIKKCRKRSDRTASPPKKEAQSHVQQGDIRKRDDAIDPDAGGGGQGHREPKKMGDKKKTKKRKGEKKNAKQKNGKGEIRIACG